MVNPTRVVNRITFIMHAITIQFMHVEVVGQHHNATILSFILCGCRSTDIDTGVVSTFTLFVAIIIEHQDVAPRIAHFHIDPRTWILYIIVLSSHIQMHHLDVDTSLAIRNDRKIHSGVFRIEIILRLHTLRHSQQHCHQP